jgi:hypothetical protein
MGSVRKTSKQVDWGELVTVQIFFKYTCDLSSVGDVTVFLDPPHILDKVDFGNGTATVADFDSESSLDKEQRTPETTPRYVLALVSQSLIETSVLCYLCRLRRAWFTASHDHSNPDKVKTTYNSKQLGDIRYAYNT